MSDFILRPAAQADREQIIELWHRAFGDSREFISDMLGCGLLESAVGAECEGTLRSVMFAFDGLEICGKRASYLLALCTQPEFRGRGMGKAVVGYAAAQAEKRGAELVFLRPADAGLERWYAENLGATVSARCKVKNYEFHPHPQLKARRISAGEYRALRMGGWSLNGDILEAQDCVHRHFGGAFLEFEGSLICAEGCGENLLVRELISREPERALEAAAGYFGTEKLALLCTGDEGTALMLLPGAFPSGKIPDTGFLPFTFD